MKKIALLLLGGYRSVASAWLGGSCRFEPSCSAYAVEAFQKHSFFSAFILSLNRVMKCRPGGGFGFDPVPSIHQQSCRGHHG